MLTELKKALQTNNNSASILDVLTEMSRKVGLEDIRVEEEDGTCNIYKTVPVVYHKLLKDVIFRKQRRCARCCCQLM